MNYELALQLKNSGFPQEESWGTICLSDISTGKEIAERCKVPPLERFIEACGEGFYNLFRCDNEWKVNYKDYSECDYDDFAYFYDSSGKTPSEAVARLWLELNKNEKRPN